MRQEDGRHRIKFFLPFRQRHSVSELDGQAFQAEDDRSVIVAQVMHEIAVADAFAVVQNAIVRFIFLAKVCPDRLLEDGKQFGKLRRVFRQRFFDFGNALADGVMVRFKFVVNGHSPDVLFILGPMGFEPMTLRLKGECSTTELRTQNEKRGSEAYESEHYIRSADLLCYNVNDFTITLTRSRPHRLVVKSPPFQGGNTGSTPVGDASVL